MMFSRNWIRSFYSETGICRALTKFAILSLFLLRPFASQRGINLKAPHLWFRCRHSKSSRSLKSWLIFLIPLSLICLARYPDEIPEKSGTTPITSLLQKILTFCWRLLTTWSILLINKVTCNVLPSGVSAMRTT